MSKLLEFAKRWRLPLSVAALVLLAAAFLTGDLVDWLRTQGESEDTISHVARKRSAAPAASAGSGISETAAVAVAASGPVDIFAVRTWEPPPPPPDLSPPPPPSPPPLPFRFIGRVDEPGKKMAFMLAEGQRIFVVSVGDSIGSAYRVESFENGQLFLRYRPMNVRQALDVRSKS
jgi:hypothetical protein